MATTKGKPKPMTVREKKERAQCRKELRESGVLPPKKKPLNRKVFVKRAKEALSTECSDYGFEFYLLWALGEMLGKRDFSRMDKGIPVSAEAIGAAKVVLLAARRREFERAQNGQSFTAGQLVEAVRDIYEA